MTDDELKNLVASLAISQKETSSQISELRASQKETGFHIKELRTSQEETDKQLKESDRKVTRQLKELGKQIGGLGRKFGSFTEGLALPSMQRILQEQFKMEIISPSVRVHKAGKDIEIDVLAYANSSVNEVYIVEVKSHLREEAITQLQDIMLNFRQFFPEHKDKKVFGILAAVDMSTELKERVRSLGFYTAKIKEDIFSLDVPKQFVAKAY
ncbi:MAG: DUF3782 domain-containing protein [Methylococcaceae bacterium]|nr:DUF3782 domain-containing protein [Methylococcaceae bacterium]